jgi:magnesium-transporting ATPase (P-type)
MKRLHLSLLRLIAVLIVPLTLGLSATASVSAVDVFPACTSNASTTDVCQTVNSSDQKQNPMIKAIKIAIIILSIIIGVASVIMIMLGGFWLITANGDAQAVARARGTVLYALIGLVVAAIAQGLVMFVLNKL